MLPHCTSQELALIFDEPSINTLKITWWTSLAMRLDIPLESVKKWQQDLILDKQDKQFKSTTPKEILEVFI